MKKDVQSLVLGNTKKKTQTQHDLHAITKLFQDKDEFEIIRNGAFNPNLQSIANFTTNELTNAN